MTRKMTIDSLEWGTTPSFAAHSNSKLLAVIVKQTLIGISVTFCNVGFLMTTCLMEMVYDSGMTLYIVTYWASYCVRATEGVVIALLLYIGLSVNDKAYQRVCGECHRKCHQCALHNFERKIDAEYQLMEDMEPDSVPRNT